MFKNKFKKKHKQKFQLAAVVLHLICGLFLIAFTDYVILIIIAEMLGGIGAGLIYVIFLIQTGEISDKSERGQLVAWGPLSIMFGSAIFAFIAYYVEFYTEPIFIIGILTVVDTFAAGILITVSNVETPHYYLSHQREDQAKNMFNYLRKDINVSMHLIQPKGNRDEPQQHPEFLEMKQYVREEVQLLSFDTMKPFIYVTLARVCSVFSFNHPLNIIVLGTFFVANSTLDFLYPVLLLIRCLGILLGLCIVDLVGRKKLFLSSGIISSLLLICAGIAAVVPAESSNSVFTIAAVFYGVFQFSAGFGLMVVPDVFSSELFPFRTKGFSVAITVCVEAIVNIVLIILGLNLSLSPQNIFFYFVVFGFSSVTFIIAIVLYFLVPETMLKSIFHNYF